MRVSNNQILSNYLSDLRRTQVNYARLLHQTSTGLAFDKPREAPYRAGFSLSLRSSHAFLLQYSRNVDDGRERTSFVEAAISDVNSQLQRLRELTVQGANTYLTRSDRSAIADEINQLLEQVITSANGIHRGRSVFAGYQTLARAFEVLKSGMGGMTSSLEYLGDLGMIDRNIGNARDLTINYTGKEVFLSQTYTLDGRRLADGPLGFAGTFELNNQLFTIGPSTTLGQLRDIINARPGIGVQAVVGSDYRLSLISKDSSQPLQVADISGTVLQDLSVLPQGAFNHALAGPTLPLTDSRGAEHLGAAIVFPLTIDESNRDLVLTLQGNANEQFRLSHSLRLTAKDYANSAELAAEIQRLADFSFGEKKIIVNDLGGSISIETGLQSGTVALSDLLVGGTADDGTVDTASVVLGLNAVTSVAEVADTAGLDGNDRFYIDLGPGAYRLYGDEKPLDLPRVEINLNAVTGLTLDDIVADINAQILTDKKLTGLLVAKNVDGRLKIETTKTGASVLASDLLLVNAVGGPPVMATDTLGALGLYVNPLTGESAPPTPASVAGAQAFPVTITAGVDDQILIDLGAASSVDGTNPQPQLVTIAPGVYATPADLALALNAAISLNPRLQNAVVAVVNGANVDLQTAAVGSRVQADSLQLTDGPLTPGALANLGLTAAAVPGGGSSAGQGLITLSDNIINTMIVTRNELYGYADWDSRLVDLGDFTEQPLGIFPGTVIRVHSQGSYRDMTVQRFTTMQDLADHVKAQLGFGIQVSVQSNGTIRVFNPADGIVQGVKLEAFSPQGAPLESFNKLFEGISGTLTYRTELRSASVYDDSKFQRLTNRLGDIDRALELVQGVFSTLGARTQRLELTLEQNDNIEVGLLALMNTNDGVDMAAALIQLKNVENTLRASLGAGAQLLPPSLFDYLR